MAVHFDRSYIESYLKDWLRIIREDNKADQLRFKLNEDKEFYVPYTGVQKKILQLIFLICKRFNINSHAKYLAIHIFDRYWSCLYWEIYSSYLSPSSSSSDISATAKRQLFDKMKSQLKIAIAVSIQIASKVDLFKTALCISQMRELMQMIDQEREYTKASICNYEIRVLKALDYRIPQNLPINVIELFLELEDLAKSELRETCLKLLDVAYFYHNQLFEQLFYMAQGKLYDKSDPKAILYLRLEANAPFMAASIVVCSCYFHMVKRKLAECIASKLAKLIDMSPVDIIIMANILQNFVIEEKDYLALRDYQVQRIEGEAEEKLNEDTKS